MTSTVRYTKGPPRLMGHVCTSLTVSNTLDLARLEAGEIAPGQVRQVTLRDVMVDTGATHLALPAGLISRLGLRVRKVVQVTTATGAGEARMFRDAELEVAGRTGTFDCLELPEGAQALLGVVPLEVLGLEPDLKQQQLRLLPEEPGHSHIFL